METIEKAWSVVKTLVFFTFGLLAYYGLFAIFYTLLDPALNITAKFIPEFAKGIHLLMLIFIFPIHMLISIAIFVIVLPMLIYGIKNKELGKLRLALLIAIFIYNAAALTWFIHWALFTDVI